MIQLITPDRSGAFMSELAMFRAGVRLLPTTGPTMLRETFPALLDGEPAPE